MNASQERSWIDGIRFLEVAVSAWILVAQAIAFYVERSPRHGQGVLISSLSLILASVTIWLGLRPTLPIFKALSISAQICLNGCASYFAIMPGFELLYFLSVIKAGLICTTKQWIVLLGLATMIYVSMTLPNANLVILQARETGSRFDLFHALIGREFLFFAGGLLLSILITRAILAERRNIDELKRAASTIAVLSAELERERIVKDITGSLQELSNSTSFVVQGVIAEGKTENTQRKLIEARDFAGQALVEVRKALNLLRAEEEKA